MTTTDDDDRAIAEALSDRDARIAELEAFKSYVHARLDEAGIPTHPDGPHSAKGCRIGDRLDIALAEVAELNAHLESLQNRFAQATGEVERLREALKKAQTGLQWAECQSWNQGGCAECDVCTAQFAVRAALGDG